MLMEWISRWKLLPYAWLSYRKAQRQPFWWLSLY
jgi:hypothetical protein